MRVDLLSGGSRPLAYRLGLDAVGLWLGVRPGPAVAITYRPELFARPLVHYIIRAMRGAGGWNKGHAELFGAFVSRLNTCRFCLGAHSAAAALHIPQQTLDAVLDDWTTADIPQRTRAALRLLEHMTRHPDDITPALIEGLRAEGLDDVAIREAASAGFLYNLVNRVADAFDFALPEGRGLAGLARLLSAASRILPGPMMDPPWVYGAGGVIRPTEVEIGRERLLSSPGATAPSLRRSVEAFVVAQWRRDAEAPVLLKPLSDYLTCLSLHSWRITDDHIHALRASGLSDEAIYEITVVGAFAGGLVGLEPVLSAMAWARAAQSAPEAG